MEAAEKRAGARAALDGYERELRLAGLAQRVAQAYTMIEGVLGYVARRIDRSPIAGDDWHKALIARCASPFDDPRRAPPSSRRCLPRSCSSCASSGMWCATSIRPGSTKRRCGKTSSDWCVRRVSSAPSRNCLRPAFHRCRVADGGNERRSFAPTIDRDGACTRKLSARRGRNPSARRVRSSLWPCRSTQATTVQ